MLIIVMGVSGCGKTTVGQLFADQIGGAFFDSDDFFTPDKVEKMRSGIPLTDDDRAGWLATLNEFLSSRKDDENPTVLACSALKQKYRDAISNNIEPAPIFIFLKGSFEMIQDRMEARTGHYMPASLLRSQFETLEDPSDAITVSIDSPPDIIVREIRRQLNS